jgi:hypothetical protein
MTRLWKLGLSRDELASISGGTQPMHPIRDSGLPALLLFGGAIAAGLIGSAWFGTQVPKAVDSFNSPKSP